MVKLNRSHRPVRFVSELARILRQMPGSHRRLFRGQCVDRPLLPKIVRVAQSKGVPPSEITSLERKMLSRFKRESLPLLPGLKPQTDWEWLSVAQHQGMATRLLDWTANALAGLWFAVGADASDSEGDGVLWILDVHPGNETQPAEKDVFALKSTYVFQPLPLDRRIVAQTAWFSVHRYSVVADRFVPLDENARFATAFTKLVVPRGRFGALRQELRMMGITQASMFPDLGGLCADVQAEMLDSWKSPTTI
jgi:hypothetical protein